jgi:peptidoglycan/LPS O-acetylase OafA/YrhL
VAAAVGPDGAAGDLDPAERRAIQAATHPAYRPDIDGLRAIAVLPVVLYHAGVRGFSGGFVGVDIFFVISGYLITGILARDIAIGRHSIREFYRRRILRIFPALATMVLATTVCACFALLPEEIGGYARSVAATAVFGSNIVFYQATDYFNQGATAAPLLHTWSLAVEEQWYIIWPLLLAAIGAGRPRATLAVAGAISAASLLLALWLMQRDSAAAFYLLPPRAWEPGFGAVLALAERAPPRGLARQGLAALGLALILASVKVYTHDTPFPGLAAIPPCLGAALLIWTGSVPTSVSRLLALPPLRFVGWISYSLYLWHWPVMVFAEIGLFLPKTPLVTAGVVLVSLLLATLSWRFVERPFREGVAGWPTPRVLAGGAMTIAALLAVAALAPAMAPRLVHYTPRETAIARYLSFDGDRAYRRDSCFAVGTRGRYDATSCLAASGRRPALLIVGDSHAAMLWPGLSRHRDRFDILQATATGCVAKLYPVDDREVCAKVIDAALRGWIATHRPAALILASHWQWRSLDGVEETLRDPFVRAAHPVLIGPMPQYGTGLPRLLVAAERFGDPGIPARAQDGSVYDLDVALRGIAARTGTRYVSLVDLLCRQRVCRTLAAPNMPLLFDGSHLTTEGSQLVVDAVLSRLARPEASRP